MKLKLLEMLCCPACKNDIKISKTGQFVADDIVDGDLECVICQLKFPIINGVPRIFVTEIPSSQTKRGFNFQWLSRLKGKCGSRSLCYGFDIKKIINWISHTYVKDLFNQKSQQWMLDAGCGSAEKTMQLAMKYPEQQVIGMDMVDTLFISAREAKEIPNCHFVQADILNPPFKSKSFDFVMSIGVLHHTNNTRRAFASISSLVKEGGGFLTWIYPLPQEDQFWAALYRQRDRHFLNLGSKLPSRITYFLCKLYVLIFFPWVKKFMKEQYLLNRDKLPVYSDELSLSDFYNSCVFLSFDNVMPSYQYRHGVDEISSWYREYNYTDINTNYSGFFYGRLI